MSDPFIAEIRMISFWYAPKGWAYCDGQLLPINQNQALFSLLGTTYGGNGQTNFALPDLRGRTPMHTGAGFTLGQAAGSASQTLTIAELPAHTHTLATSSAPADATGPAGAFPADGGVATYSAGPPNSAMAASAAGPTGGSQAHPNQSPFAVIGMVIALVGIFPPRS